MYAYFPSTLTRPVDEVMTISRRTFSAALIAGAAGSLTSTRGMAANPVPTKARNIVLVHGLFADGSLAKRMRAKTIEVKSSHVSLISHPEEITQLILEAAQA